MNILYTNAQSLPGKINELVAQSQILLPDIILIAETWLNDEISNATLAIPGYNIEQDLRKDRCDTTNGIGGGLLVYTKENTRVVAIDENNEFNQYCKFILTTEEGPIQFILIYRPPSLGERNLEELCKLATGLDVKTIMIGDFNVPGTDWHRLISDKKGRNFMELTIRENLEQLVDFSTHIKGNILDLVITNCPDIIVAVEDVGRLGTSDHVMINVTIGVGLKNTIPGEKRLNWNRANFGEIRQELAEIDWKRKLKYGKADDNWETFKSIINKVTDKHVPKTVYKNMGRPRWVNRDILQMLKKKKSIWTRLKREGGDLNRREYNDIEKQVKKAIIKSKRRLEKELANSSDRNGKKFRSYVKAKTKTRVTVGPLKDSSGAVLTGNKEMANELNKFFSSVFTREDLNTVPRKDLETAVRLETIRITEKEIIKKIEALKADSAAGPDKISPRFLKETRFEVATPLKIIMEKSLKEGTVPEDWKMAHVVPIYKKGAKGVAGNYRPVSLTSVPCKMMESLIKDAVMAHLLDNKLINDSQHGFMPGRSCATNLIQFFENVTKYADKGVPVDIFYLDFAKAFDKVPTERLLTKLKAKGVDGRILEWLRVWLSGRQQKVTIGGEFSEECEVESGVPQGTVMGPCLFTVFIDDLDMCAAMIEQIIKFADDTKGMQPIRGPEDRDRLQDCLDNLYRWAMDWGMQFNTDKCKIMHIGRNNPRYEYKMGGVKLGVVEEEKDVGIIIHNSLKPAKHCRKAATKALSVLGQIRRNFHFRDRHVFLKLYKQYVRPHVEFASPAWAPSLKSDIEVIEKVQMKAVKMVSGLVSNDYGERCAELGLETLEERRVIQDMAQVHKIITGKDKLKKEELFKFVSGGHGQGTRLARDPLNLRAEKAKTETRKGTFTQRIVTTWNNIDARTKSLRTADSFKKALRQQRRLGVMTGPNQAGNR